MFVHAFGAYFGLAVAWALDHTATENKETKDMEMADMENEDNASRYDSDVSAVSRCAKPQIDTHAYEHYKCAVVETHAYTLAPCR